MIRLTLEIEETPENVALVAQLLGIAPAPVVAQVPGASLPRWSSERVALLGRRFNGTKFSNIVRELNELPGAPINVSQARSYASGVLKLRAGRRLPQLEAWNNRGSAKVQAMQSATVPEPPAPRENPLSALPASPIVPPPAPVALRPAARQPAPIAPKPAPAPQPKSRAEAMAAVSAAVTQRTVSFEAVRQWAAQRGITCDTRDDLPAVQAKRQNLGLPPFVLKAVG